MQDSQDLNVSNYYSSCGLNMAQKAPILSSNGKHDRTSSNLSSYPKAFTTVSYENQKKQVYGFETRHQRNSKGNLT